MAESQRSGTTLQKSDSPVRPGIWADTPSTVDTVVNAKLAGFLLIVLAVLTVVHEAGDPHYDFGVFYYAAHMVLDGSGNALYDLSTQHAFQARYGRPPDLLFYYPPFALVPFLPLAFLPISLAFIVWTTISLALLVASLQFLCRQFGLQYGNWPILLALIFMPVATALGHGQLSIVCLAAYVWCYGLLRKGQSFAGGLILSVALLKFQLVLGFASVLFLRRKWRELAGLVTGSVPLVVASVWMVGFSGLLQYPAVMLKSDAARSVDPTKMGSIRGFASLLTSGTAGVELTLVLSIAAVLYAAFHWRDLASGFNLSVIASLLVGYHVNPQDLSLAIIPVCFLIGTSSRQHANYIVISAIGLPMLVVAVGGCFAVLMLPLAFLLFVIGGRFPGRKIAQLP